MSLLDWVTDRLRDRRAPSPSGQLSNPMKARTVQIGRADHPLTNHTVSSGLLAASRGIAYPLCQPRLDPLPAIIHRALEPLEQARQPAHAGAKTWARIHEDVRGLLAELFTRIEPYLSQKLSQTQPDPFAQLASRSEQAAWLLSAGAWAAGYADRVKARPNATGWPVTHERAAGSIPSEAWGVLEPAIHFGLWLVGTTLDGYYASAYGAAERTERDAQLLALFRAFRSAAAESYGLGLTFKGALSESDEATARQVVSARLSESARHPDHGPLG